MIARWEKGRPTVDGLLEARELERVVADRKLADAYLDAARRHLESSRITLEIDPTGSFQIAYDATRKAWVAVLINQGPRPTSRGGHLVIERAMRAQFTPPPNDLIGLFGWMRTLRNASEYPSFDKPAAEAADALKAQDAAARTIAKAAELLDLMPVY